MNKDKYFEIFEKDKTTAKKLLRKLISRKIYEEKNAERAQGDDLCFYIEFNPSGSFPLLWAKISEIAQVDLYSLLNLDTEKEEETIKEIVEKANENLETLFKPYTLDNDIPFVPGLFLMNNRLEIAICLTESSPPLEVYADAEDLQCSIEKNIKKAFLFLLDLVYLQWKVRNER